MAAKIISLNYPLANGMMKYPSDPSPIVDTISSSLKIKREEIWCENSCLGEATTETCKSGFTNLQIRSHHGTHIDAPYHKDPNGRKINWYPGSKFINPCYLVNLVDLFRDSFKREITPSDLEGRLGDYSECGAVIFYTGYCDKMDMAIPSQKQREEVESGFPYLHHQSAERILQQFPHLNVLGIDSFSVDPRGSNSLAHRTLFKKDVLILETLFHLSELENPIVPFTLYSLPINIAGADAAPASVYAELK